MVTCATFIIISLSYILWRIHIIANETIKQEENKEKYKYLYEEIRTKMYQIEKSINDLTKRGEVDKSDELSRKYNVFFYNHLKDIMSPLISQRDYYYDDNKTNYPIKDMRTALNKFDIEFPEVFKMENRNRKIDLILGN